GMAFAILREHLHYHTRDELEGDPSRKQIIPYIVVLTQDHRVFTLRRRREQSEARLHGKLSIGVGGHLEREDAEHDDPITAGMWREFAEEILVPASTLDTLAPIYRGVLNDDSTEVGAVHLGVVFTVLVPEPQEIHVGEPEKMEGSWWRPVMLQEHADRLETWSALLLGELTQWWGPAREGALWRQEMFERSTQK
ncbi:MAG: hypothetical protein AAGI01_17350, partial [Myxococcota bacterium]